MSLRFKRIFISFGITAAYLALALLGRSPIFTTGIASVFWLPAAVSAFAAWRFGYLSVPPIFLGQALIGLVLGPRTWAFVLLPALGNAIAAGLLVWRLHRPRFSEGFLHKQSLTLEFVLTLMITNLVNAAFGSTGIYLSIHGLGDNGWGIQHAAKQFISNFWPWWSGDVAALLMAVPWMVEVSLLHKQPLPLQQKPMRMLALFVPLVFTILVFLPLETQLPQSTVFLLMPPLLWLAILGNNKITTGAILLTVLVASALTLRGVGPFSHSGTFVGLLQLQLFTIILSATVLLVASGVSERQNLCLALAKEAQLLEARVQERTEELGAANGILEEQNEKLKRLASEKNSFMGMAAHDLRNPLNGIALRMELIKEETDPAEIRQSIGEVHRAVNRMAELISRLLEVSAIESGKRKVHLVSLDTGRILERLFHEFSPRAEAKGIKLRSVLPSPPPSILGDESMLLEVMENLVSNAIKFTPCAPPAREICLSASQVKDQTVLEVIDSGPGFSSEDLEQAFLAFSKLTAKPTNGESSTGLGLFIVKQMVTAMGGRVELQSQLGLGSTIRITLPST